MKYRWNIARAEQAQRSVLCGELRVSPLLAQCLVNRGLVDPEPARRFLQPRLQDLSDPFLLPNMAAAVARLFEARTRQEPVVLFGDYDVDGVTSCTLLSEVMERMGWTVQCYLPHRREEGYGLSQAGAANCLAQFPTRLLVAVDCGSTSVETVQWLREKGVDTVVLDHHQVSSPAPAAVALVNPHLNSSPDPAATAARELCSAGLSFKLAHALVKEGRGQNIPEALTLDLRAWLELVALGTIADLVPLRGENRILVRAGLERLGTTARPGLVALKEVADVGSKVGAYQVGFQLAPRLNAAGRLETATDSLRLLRTRDLDEARQLAQGLDAQNRERQRIERGIAEEVIQAVRARFNPVTDQVIVEGQADWHIGVVGIVASRVLHEFYRPTLILGGEGESWRGSGRSIAGFDLAAALRECDDLLLRHGGHPMAAGITMAPEQLPALRARLNQIARRTLQPEQFQPALQLDATVRASELGLDQVRELSQLDQTGIGNPAVQVLLPGLRHARPLQRIGADKKHAKLWITDGGVVHEAVMWGVGDGALPVGRFDLACVPQISDYNGEVQLKVLDWRPEAVADNPHPQLDV